MGFINEFFMRYLYRGKNSGAGITACPMRTSLIPGFLLLAGAIPG